MTEDNEYRLEVFGEYFKITILKIETVINIFSIKEIETIRKEDNNNTFEIAIHYVDGEIFNIKYNKKEPKRKRDIMFESLDKMISEYYRDLINKRKEIF